MGVVALSSLTLLAAGAQFSGLTAKARDAISPLKKTGKSASKPIDEAIARLSVGELRKQNAELRRELDAAKSDANRYVDAVRQRSQLLALLQLQDADSMRSVPARVIDVGLGLFDDRILLDVGSDDGVVMGAPVTTGAGLVGRVVVLSPKESVVLLISDPASSVGVRLSTTGEVGIAKGTLAGKPLRVDLISPNTPVARGDLLVTSGLQRSVYPPGIPVGSVRTVKSGAIQKEITMTPLADLEHLEFVKVLLPGSGPRAVVPLVPTEPASGTDPAGLTSVPPSAVNPAVLTPSSVPGTDAGTPSVATGVSP